MTRIYGEFYQTFKEEPITTILKLFQKLKWKEHFLTHSETSIAVMPKPDKDTARKENYRPLSLTSINAKSVNTALADCIQ
jgi:hypothetical protein